MSYSNSEDSSNDYTGTCNITRMVWNIEGTMTWHQVRTALLNTEGKAMVEYSEKDIEAIAMDMVRNRYRLFSLKQDGRQMFIRAKGSCNSLNEFNRSWAAAIIGSGTMRAKRGSRAYEMNRIMSHLSPDFQLLRERLIVAHTMLIAKTGFSVA